MANEIKTIRTIPLSKIHDLPGVTVPNQPDKAYGGLVTSIQAAGVKEPVILRLREDGQYQLVAGYRRRRACELANRQEIPALVYQMTVQEAVQYRVKANLEPKLPVPGKLLEPPGKEPGKENKPPVPDGKQPEAPAPETKPKSAEGPKPAEKKPEEVPAAKEPKKAPASEKPAPAKEEGTQEPKTADKPKEAAVPDKTRIESAPKEKSKEAAAAQPPLPEKKPEPTKPQPAPPMEPAKAPVSGPAAQGPAGTAISQVLEARLAPPDEQALKDLPTPKEGESIFITLHPAYLEKSPFNVFSVDQSSENYRELKKSVELVGIKDPVLARRKPEGGLEILSGQRRHLAALALNYPVPTIIQKIDDADAKIIVADGNLHRDKISSYDLSRALRMKMEGMKQKSGRRKKGEIKAEELDSDEKLAQEMGMKVSKLNRILRLSEAVKEVCDRVDDGSLPLSIASAISFLKPENQDEALHLMDIGYKVTNERAERMKKADKAGKLTEAVMRTILEDKDLAPKQAAPVPQPAAPVIPASPDVKPAPEAAVQTPPASGVSFFPPVTPAAPTGESKTEQASVPAVPAGEPPKAEPEIFKGEQGRPEYTKVILTGDRLRKYFPDVSMTPREIEESIYDALEERRQRQVKTQQKEAIFQKGKPPVR